MSTDRRKMPPTTPKSGQREETTNVTQAVADLIFDELAEGIANGRNKTIAEIWEIEALRINVFTFRVRAKPADGVPRYFTVRVSEEM